MIAWLDNAELGFTAAPTIPDKLTDLTYSAQFAGAWIDKNLIVGNPQNETIAKRALALFTSLGDMTKLEECGVVLRWNLSINLHIGSAR